ncbi:MAG: YcjX family protein, partial [Paracoccaceae bacterium]|nr:YcjX family protein [Paracoccaceae bacterium]
PRFDFETHLGAMTGPKPFWPESTRAISELRLSLLVQPSGLWGAVGGPRKVHIDIVDYPGEWLLDLALLDQTFADWSEKTLARMKMRDAANDYLSGLGGFDPAAPLEESTAQKLAASFTGYLARARMAGFSDYTPGRFLLPGDLAGSPALTFAPLPTSENPPRGSIWREMDRRFEAYKSKVVKPFFRDHFARIDRQVVLVDVLGAVHAGPEAVADLRGAMAGILSAFRPGRNRFLSQILLGMRVEKILFAATKADHIHHAQHPRLTSLMEALVKDARSRADFAGAETRAMSIASLRCTTEETRRHDGAHLDLVRGRLEDGRQAAFYPGELPPDPSYLLAPGQGDGQRWLDGDFSAMAFSPAPLTLAPGNGPPHIRLDKAAEFLFGDRL